MQLLQAAYQSNADSPNNVRRGNLRDYLKDKINEIEKKKNKTKNVRNL